MQKYIAHIKQEKEVLKESQSDSANSTRLPDRQLYICKDHDQIIFIFALLLSVY